MSRDDVAAGRREPAVSDAWTSERAGPPARRPRSRHDAFEETPLSPSTRAPLPRLVTVTQAADHLDSTTSKLYELVARHALPSVRIGRAIRIPGTPPATSRPGPPEPRPRFAPSTSLVPTGSRATPASSLNSTTLLIASARVPPHPRPTSDAVPMPDRRHREQQASDPRQPNSCETRNPDTDLHPRATCRRVDTDRTREARS